MTGRRPLLQAALLALVPLGCKRPPARRQVLEGLVTAQAIPDVHEVLFHSQALAESTATLTVETVPVARERWRAAVLAWKRAYCFRNGPLVTSGAFLRATFWPTRTARVEAIARGQQPIDSALLEELGADEKGIFALEHLLFPAGAALVEETSPEGGRARQLAGALADAVTVSAQAAVRSLGDGRLFTAAYADKEQESLNLLINQLVETIESIANSRMARLLEPDRRAPVAGELEGLAGGVAFAIPAVLVEGSARLYLGTPGLGDLVRAISKPVDARARAAFAGATAALQPLVAAPTPAALGNRAALQAAARAIKELELAIKVDVASALGVTLTFVSGDGD